MNQPPPAKDGMHQGRGAYAHESFMIGTRTRSA